MSDDERESDAALDARVLRLDAPATPPSADFAAALAHALHAPLAAAGAGVAEAAAALDTLLGALERERAAAEHADAAHGCAHHSLVLCR